MRQILLPFLFCTFAVLTGASDRNTIYRRLHHNPQESSCILLEQEIISRRFKGFRTAEENELKISTRPAISGPAESMLLEESSNIVEIWGKRETVVDAHVASLCRTIEYVKPLDEALQQDIEIQKIVDGGDQANRIDVVFMGDGYTPPEKQQFFDDILRLTVEMFEGVTFKSYLPVFNIWAIYVPSVESGIGYDGAKDTPFRLYRAQGQLRGIYTGNAPYARTVCAMTGTSGCNYPSLIGNDDFYGGLGGEFVISTKSNRTGTTVLRHEMGHNFVNVGEEYDNGGAYRGVNSADSLATIGWGSWLTNGPQLPTVEERTMYRILEYPWVDLWTGGIQTFNFTSDGNYNRWVLSVTVSAAGEADSLEFTLDGAILPWTSHGFDDREFYDWEGGQGFAAGNHSFTVRTKTPPTNQDIPRMICSVRLYEFGTEEEYHMNNSHVAAYPTWDVNFRKRFRPTNQGCLMRNMTNPEFCNICKEGMWHQFMARISLVDGVEIANTTNPDFTRTVTLSTLQLGQLRTPGTEIEGERLEIRWFYQGTEQPQHQDAFQINASSGSWSVLVRFITPEVRHDPDSLLVDTETFAVPI